MLSKYLSFYLILTLCICADLLFSLLWAKSHFITTFYVSYLSLIWIHLSSQFFNIFFYLSSWLSISLAIYLSGYLSCWLSNIYLYLWLSTMFHIFLWFEYIYHLNSLTFCYLSSWISIFLAIFLVGYPSSWLSIFLAIYLVGYLISIYNYDIYDIYKTTQYKLKTVYFLSKNRV